MSSGCQPLLGLDDYQPLPAAAGAGGTDSAANPPNPDGGADGPGAPSDAPDASVADADASLPNRPIAVALDAGDGDAGLADAGLAEAGGAAPVVLLEGSVVTYHTGAVAPVLRLDVVRPAGIAAPARSDESGGFRLEASRADVVVSGGLGLWLTEVPPGPNVPALFSTIVDVASPGSSVEPLPSVNYDWLATTAQECGALPAAASPAQTSAYFSTRSTLIVEAPGAEGLERDSIRVLVSRSGEATGWLNVDDSSGVDDGGAEAAPARVCFLEADASGNPIGGTANAVTPLARFVMFRVRNATGTGSGLAEVQVDGFAAESLAFGSAGKVGLVRVETDD